MVLRPISCRLAGFTLLEMLVVLIMIGLITVLLLQGAAYVFQLRSRLLIHLNDLQQGAIQEFWFRSTTAAIVTDYNDGKHIFRGDEHEFSGLTLAALDMTIGAPTAFAWQLQSSNGVMVLRYQNSRNEYWEVSRWTGDPDQSYFRYMAKDGEWHTQWPPQFGLEPPQIPRLIRLQGQRRQTPITWIVKLAEYDTTRLDYRTEPF